MSILDFLCALWRLLETLVLDFMSIFGDGTVAPCGDGTVEGGPWIHPKHRLQQTDRHELFVCTACKEYGFGRSYSCEPCEVHVHKECTSPPPAVPHPECPGDLLFVRSVQTYDTDTDTDDSNEGGGGGKFCRACSKPLRGCGYKSADGKSRFHPCCLHLERFIKVNGENLQLRMENVSLGCKWCKKVSIKASGAVIPSWFYVLMGKDGCFHVGCIRDMMCLSWMDGGLDLPVRGKKGDNTTNFATCLSIKIEITIDPSESATEELADSINKAAAKGDKSEVKKSIKRFWAGPGSGSVWENTQYLWQLLRQKVREGIDSLGDSPVGRVARKVWSIATQPSKLWDLVRPFLLWASSKLIELAMRMIGMSMPQGYLQHGAQAY